MIQISLFDGKHQFKITKPIRLIELFAGIGSQAKALRNLGANFEHYRICEFDKYAVQSYNEIHGTSFETSDITKIKAADLGITETDKYEYIMTYSFPCQDLSLAGKQSGMAKGSGTRSGLLWEVERLLNEMTELPQILLMENVPQVHGKKNIDSFREWQHFLECKGYKNYWQDLNAKNFGIPQNRKRCFMVSVLGNYYYDFPKEIPLKLRLKDMLESNVDEKYYLSDKAIKLVTNKMRLDKKYTQINGDIALCHTARNQTNGCGDMVAEPVLKQVAELQGRGFTDCTRRVYSSDGLSPTIQTLQGGNREPKIATSNIKNIMTETATTLGTNCGSSTSAGGGVVIEPNLKTQLCNKLIEENRVKEFDVIRHSYSNSRLEDKREIAETNNISPTLDTRCDCLGVVEPIIVDADIKQCVRKNYEREKEQIAQSDKEIYQCECESGFQDNKVGIKVSPTLRAGNSHTAVYNNYRIRKLTPKECWRLMGFTDSDFDKAKASGVSNSQLYKQAGNSIVVDVLMAIFKEIL